VDEDSSAMCNMPIAGSANFQGSSYENGMENTAVSTKASTTPSKSMPAPQKCVWSCHVLDL